MSRASVGPSIQKVKAPERGSFPLDHFGECRALRNEYMQCLNRRQHDNSSCRYLAKQYMQCRMDNKLMALENLENMGYRPDELEEIPERKELIQKLKLQEENRKEVSGFVQGLGMLKSSDSRGRGLFGKAIEVALKKLSAFVKPKPIENVPNGDASSESSAPHSPDQRPAAYTDGIHV
eukprot:GHVT01087259.1.p1 GENE.GHVT01087259.1~~GHVT01087259.1.p1  ORF type:complete len:178 (+),score=23.28 GHVT01087259.1:3672-4205(+)